MVQTSGLVIECDPWRKKGKKYKCGSPQTSPAPFNWVEAKFQIIWFHLNFMKLGTKWFYIVMKTNLRLFFSSKPPTSPTSALEGRGGRLVILKLFISSWFWSKSEIIGFALSRCEIWNYFSYLPWNRVGWEIRNFYLQECGRILE